jgi:hypothetical protein
MFLKKSPINAPSDQEFPFIPPAYQPRSRPRAGRAGFTKGGINISSLLITPSFSDPAITKSLLMVLLASHMPGIGFYPYLFRRSLIVENVFFFIPSNFH